MPKRPEKSSRSVDPFLKNEPIINFNTEAQMVLALARKEADRLNHNYVGTEHLLLGMLKLEKTTATYVLEQLGVDRNEIRAEAEKQVGMGGPIKILDPIPYAPAAKLVFSVAIKEAETLNHDEIGTGHLLLGLVRAEEGFAGLLLRKRGLDADKVRGQLLKAVNLGFSNEEHPQTNSGMVSPPQSTAPYPTSRSREKPPRAASSSNPDESFYRFVPRANFTPRAQQVLALAKKEAERLNQRLVRPVHLLVGLVKLGQGVATNVLTSLGIDLEIIRGEVARVVGRETDEELLNNTPSGHDLKQFLEFAVEESKALKHTYTGTEHLLLSLLRLQDGDVQRVLTNLKVDVYQVRQMILKELDPNFAAEDEQSNVLSRLRSGEMTLGELLAKTDFGNSMDEADIAAFRVGAALAYTQKSPEMNSMDVFEGYLLSGRPGRGQSEQALVKVVWDNYAVNRPDPSPGPIESQQLEMWRIFSRRPLDDVIKFASQSEPEILDVRLASGLGRMLVRSVEVATEAGRPQPFSTRHFLACLLGPREWPLDPESADSINNLRLHLPTIRREFRDWMRQWRKEDNAAVMDAVLGLGEVLSNDHKQSDADANTDTYQKTYSAFIPDRAAYGRRAADAQLDDALGVGVHAGHLAQLIAAKETWMPLSIGLFGAWGAGKSHFIDLIDEHLRALTREPGKVFHQEIVQIRFNAWHYLDTNLWANLVCEIFDQLFDKFEKRGDKEAKQVENLKKKLADQSALAAEAKTALDTAENARKDAEDRLLQATRARAVEEKKVAALLDDLSALAINADVKKQLSAVASGLGLPKLETSFAELETRAAEVRSLGGRTKALALAVFTGPGWWTRGLLLVAALAVPLWVAWLANHGVPWMKDLLAGAGRTITQAVVTISALSAWLSMQAKAGNSLVGKLENAYEEVKKVRATREAKDDATLAQKTLAARRQAEEEARHALHEAEEKMKAIRVELAELAPGRQLIRFLKERASAEDYRRHLGLVSLVRKDFEQLSKLLTEVQDVKDAPLPKIDRIVLYIDDLDRCRADRVIEVLEAVHLLLAFPLFAVVVAVDPRWLRQSLLDHYKRLLGGADDDATNSRTRTLGRPATPQDYLEKIFQVPFNLQPMEKTGFEMLVKQLFPVRATPEGTGKAAATNLGAISSPSIVPRSPMPAPLPELESNLQVEISNSPVSRPATPEAPSQPKQPPPDPKRLALTTKEVVDVQRFQPLFQTPRAVKRLANTYCLIRVGVNEDAWTGYLGPNDTPGVYRVPMLLLAVTSAFPVLARPWLLWLSKAPPRQWQLTKADIELLITSNSDTTDEADWHLLANSLDQLALTDWPAPNSKLLQEWVPRVARYSF